MEGAALAFAPQSSSSFASGTGSRHPPPPPTRPRSRALQLPPLSSNLRLHSSRGFQLGSRLRCRSTTGSSNTPGPGSSGDNDSKAVLDAFFLGKAFAEALNERVGFAVGEILSVIGQWQAEQQKQVLVFQEEVMLKAKLAKEKAALEALEGELGLSKLKEKAEALEGQVGLSKVEGKAAEALNGLSKPLRTASGPAQDDPFGDILKG